jgi:phage tail-like protein
MATSKAEMKASYPRPASSYIVNFGKNSISVSEVTGVNIQYEMTTYKESQTDSGKIGPRVFYMPAQAGAVTITLKKAVIPEISKVAFYDWIDSIRLNQVDKQDVTISLYSVDGEPEVVWTIYDAFPTKLEAPGFNASSNDPAIETIELKGTSVSINYTP